jgi:elongation factor P
VALSINDIKNSLTILVDGEVFLVLTAQPVKPGKGAAFVRVKLKNLRNQAVLEKTFRGEERIDEAFIDQKKLQYLYHSGDTYHFMDQENYEEIAINKSSLGNMIDYLKDNLELSAYYHDGKLLNINLPNFIVYKIIRTETGLKGDTVKAGTKPATVESGLTVQVPLFINEGDNIKVDTRTGEYIERAP